MDVSLIFLAVSCSYKKCTTSNWGSWSGECGAVNRTRELYSETPTQTQQYGGCAGMEQSCVVIQQKDMGRCKQKKLFLFTFLSFINY